MALAKVIGFADFVLTLGDGATPTEVFTAPCAFNSRALNLTKNLSEIIVPDCDDEAKPGWIVRDPLSVAWDIAGEGLIDDGSIDTWDAWFLQTEVKNVKLTITKTDGITHIIYSGAAHLQSWNRTASRGEFLTYTVAISGSGPLGRAPALPLATGASFMDGVDDTMEFMQQQANRRARHAAAAQPAKPAKKAKEAA